MKKFWQNSLQVCNFDTDISVVLRIKTYGIMILHDLYQASKQFRPLFQIIILAYCKLSNS